MLIIVYLNKPYILHYYTLSRLYSTKHNHTPLYNPMHHHPTPCTPTPHQIPLNIHPFITPCTSILHHIPLFITIHLYKSPYTYEGYIGGYPIPQCHQEKLANTEISCRKSMKYRYRIYDQSSLL